jgi:CubicO group peptidase (beta-lactamase class C family)
MNKNKDVKQDKKREKEKMEVSYQIEKLVEYYKNKNKNINKNKNGSLVVVEVQNDKNKINQAMSINADKSERQKLYHIGSIGKQFTALAIMILNDRCYLKFDDCLLKYLPELKFKNSWANDVTLRHLLNHTSTTLPSEFKVYSLARVIHPTHQPTNEDELKILVEFAKDDRFKNKIKGKKPGDKFLYTDVGYDILGMVIERCTGIKYEIFMQDNIFKPLGMNSTFSLNGVNDPRRLKALNDNTLNTSFCFLEEQQEKEHKKGKKSKYNRDDYDGFVGSGSIYSTLDDMIKYHTNCWCMNKLNIRSETWLEAVSPSVLNNNTTCKYGFGLWTRKHYICHTGSWLGFTSLYQYFPSVQIAVISFTNTRKCSLREIHNNKRYSKHIIV